MKILVTGEDDPSRENYQSSIFAIDELRKLEIYEKKDKIFKNKK